MRSLARFTATALAALLTERVARLARARHFEDNVLWDDVPTKLSELGRALLVARVPGTWEWIVLGVVVVGAAALWLAEIRPRRAFGRSRPDAAVDAAPGLSPARQAAGAPDRASAAAPSDDPGAQRVLSWVRLLALLALVLYAVLPYSIYARDLVTYGLFILYLRFLVLAPLLLLPTLRGPRRPKTRAALAILVCALHVLLAWDWHRLLAAARDDAAGLDGAVASIPPGKIVKSLIYTPYPTGARFEAFLHAASYYQARALGEVDQSFALLPVEPVHYRQPLRPYLSRNDEHLDPAHFDWSQVGRYDFVLIYDRGGTWQQAYAPALPAAVYRNNGWLVVDVQRLGGGGRRDPG